MICIFRSSGISNLTLWPHAYKSTTSLAPVIKLIELDNPHMLVPNFRVGIRAMVSNTQAYTHVTNLHGSNTGEYQHVGLINLIYKV